MEAAPAFVNPCGTPFRLNPCLLC